MIQQFLEELSAAEAFEQIRRHGYDEILAMPPSLLSNETRAEVFDALQWSNLRYSKLVSAKESVQALLDNGFPGRVQQIAQESAITELKDRLEMMRLAVAEFDTAPTGTVEISEELPVNQL